MSESRPEGAVERGALGSRVERYASLRGALRALSPSTRLEEAGGLDDAFREVRGWLREATAAAGPGDSDSAALAAQVAKIDFALDAIGGEIIARLREVPLAQLRATLPDVCQRHPEEVSALLDLWLADQERAPEWLHFFDYVVTLLACDVVDGRRRLARDPVRVTARLEQQCEAAAAEAGESAHELAREFERAREELERGDDVRAVVARMRARKKVAPAHVLVPDVLRAIVRYNLVVRSRFDELDEVDRTLGDLELSNVRPAPEPLAPAAPAEAGSVFESAGLLAIVRALQDRLAGKPQGTGSAARMASELELAKLAPFEAKALRDASEEPPDPALQLAAVLLLAGRRSQELAGGLAELGIDRERVRGCFLPELNHVLSARMRALVEGDRFAEARSLADLRTRLLGAWSEAPSAWQLDPPLRSNVTPGFGATAADARRGDRSGRAAAPRSLRALALGTLVVAMLGAGLLRLGTRGNPNVLVYGPSELALVSPHLASGYRDGLGHGRLFIGTLQPEFERLPEPRRRQAAEQAARALEAVGVREVLLFDGARRMQAHWVGGHLEFPPPPR